MKLVDSEEILQWAEKYYEEKGYDPSELHFSLNDMRGNYGCGYIEAIPIQWLEEMINGAYVIRDMQEYQSQKWKEIDNNIRVLKRVIEEWRTDEGADCN